MREGQIPSKPLVNLPGCPPIPDAISAVLAHYLVFERFPVLDDLNRPRAFDEIDRDRDGRIGEQELTDMLHHNMYRYRRGGPPWR